MKGPISFFYARFLMPIGLIVLVVACNTAPSESLKIAASSNVQYAIQEIVDSFQQQTGIKSEIVLGSSGKLTAQIEQGAPFDLFLSADKKYPKRLEEVGLTLGASKTYALGKLVVWTMQTERPPAITMMLDSSVQHIAIANPKTAPYGAAAMEVLTRLRIDDLLEDKLVFGENIGQTTQFITTEAAQMGITAKSIALSPQLNDKGKWIEIAQNLYTPIRQDAVIIQHQALNQEAAQQFFDFLFSEPAKLVFDKYGYGRVNEQ